MNLEKPMNPRRSSLIIPAHKMQFVEKSYTRNADAITFDLEDGVSPDSKEQARTNLKTCIEIGSRGGADIWVRINNEPELLTKDLEAAIQPGLKGITIPKAETVENLLFIENEISRIEQERGMEPNSVRTHLTLESAMSLLNMRDLAANSTRGYSMTVGHEDLSKDLGIELRGEAELANPCFWNVVICKAYGLMPIGLVSGFAGFKDLDGLAKQAKVSLKLGLRGGSCIHPDQVKVLNECFAPDPQDVAFAKKALAAFEEGLAKGDGAVRVDGRMVDKPVIKRAKNTLAWYDRLAAFEAYKQKMLAANT